LTLAQPVVGGGVVDPAAREEGIRQRFELVEKIGMQKYAEQHVPQSCAPGADAAVLAKGIALTAVIPQSGYLRQFRSLRHANILEWSSRVRIPAMIVSGENDRTAATGMVKEIADAMRGIRHEQVADIGHMIYLEYPERFNALLEGLLAEVE